MRNRLVFVVLIAGLTIGGCRPSAPEKAGGEPEAAPAAGPVLDAHDPTILRRPFTAEEIRAEWAPGLTLTMRRTTPDAEVLARWTVVAADTEGVDIEYATVDAGGQVVGEPRVERSSWVELRDHATFSAAHATSEETVRDTALGMLNGWVYTVRDDEAGTVTELFFARSLPGAPVEMRMTRDGAVVMELSQIARR